MLLHGFPTSSHMFRDLIPRLAGRFLDNLARIVDRFTEVVGLVRLVLYVFDYGAPRGFRIAMRPPNRIAAIISRNGNAYEEGLNDGWNPVRAYRREPTPANREALRAFLTP